MAYPVSLEQLLNRVRQRTNLEGASAFIGDMELTDSINVAIASWWDLVRLTTFGGQYARNSWAFTTTANQPLYALPPNCASILSIDANINGNSYAISAFPYQEEQRNMFKLLPFVGWSFGIQSVWYQKQGENINFLPTPTQGYNIVVNYVPTAPILATLEDSLNSFNGWEECIVLDAGIKCLLKCGRTEEIPAFQSLLEVERERIKGAAAQADMLGTEGVHETVAYSNWSTGGFFW
jgi:hypothetical protein